MNVTPRRMRRTGLTLLTALALLVPAAATVAVTATPAQAASPGSSSSDSGGTQGTSKQGNGDKDSNPGYYCDYKTGNLWKKKTGGNLLWTTHQAQCEKGKAGTISQTYRGVNKLCPVGFQVFRFYGSGAQAARGWTTTILNQRQWCLDAKEQAAKLYTFWSTSGYDVSPGIGSSSAYTQNTTAERGVRVSANPSRNGAAENVRFGPVWTASNTKYSAPGKAFDGNKACVEMMNKANPIRAFLAADLASPEGQQVAMQLKSAFDSTSKTQGAEAAKKETGVSAFTMGAGGKSVTRVTWIDANCSSPMMYVSTNKAGDNSAAGLAAQRYTGVCYIPLERHARVFQKVGGSALTDSFDTANAGYGLRYSNFYRNKALTKADPRGVTGKAATAAEKKILNQWRAAMDSWYRNKIHKRYDGAKPDSDWSFLNDGGKFQAIPADPYNVNSSRTPVKAGQKFDREKAVTALSDWSKCRFGTNYEFQSTSTDGGGDDARTRLDLRMANVDVFHAGGYARAGGRDQTITVTPSALTCVGGDCAAARPTLASLSYEVNVNMPGYKFCDTSTSGGPGASLCDYAVTKVSRGGTALKCVAKAGRPGCIVNVAGTSAAPLTLSFTFFTPTEASEKVQVTVSDVKAAYQYSSGSRSMTVTLIDSTTGKVTNKVIETAATRKTRQVENTNVTGAPVALTPDGNGGHVFRAPVIGAVASR